MTIHQSNLAGRGGEMEERSGSDGRTVLVGLKLDSESRELLTWALVKVARPGDSVIALHVLGNNEIVDRNGKSSLFSIVEAFDSLLAVYEGFCNLRQVDLKLKICRGSSIRKVLIREAESYSAANLVVGTSTNHHTIRSWTSVAKYCAKKLHKDCCVLAVHNGKIVYQRAGSPSNTNFSLGKEDYRQNGLINVIHRAVSMNKGIKTLHECDANSSPKKTRNQFEYLDLGHSLLKFRSDSVPTVKNCSVCSPDDTESADKPSTKSSDECSGEEATTSMAIVPFPTAEAPSSSVTTLIRQLPDTKPGWPLLRRAKNTDRQSPDRNSSRKISVVQWALRLPSRDVITSSDLVEETSTGLDGVTGAIVPVSINTVTTPPFSPDRSPVSLPRELAGLHEKHSATCRLFNYQQLLAATSNFLDENLVGKGGSSQVYRGCLPDNKELAVKILKPSEDMLEEFVLEIDIITTLNHKNIISLLGFCFDDNNLLLVYDFLSRGSLEENLHGDKKDSVAFGWSQRYKVAVGVAEALDYLHSGTTQPVIHRDVKSSNILLSDDFEPQLSDFGLAKWASNTSTHITCTDVAGTFGYMAPEYFMYGKVNEKIDVYAYGVVLLELLSGRKPISNDYPKGQESLVMWAEPILNGGKVSGLLDPSLGDNYDPDQMERIVLVATLCIRRAPRARPPMSLVQKLLQGDDEVTKWAKQQINAFEESDTQCDDEVSPRRSDIQSHLNLALLDVVDDDSISINSIEQQCVSLEDYMQGRWSRSSSFD